MTDPYVALVYFALVLLAVCLAGWYLEWRHEDRMRRLERQVHRNLQRAAGHR